MSPLRRRAAYAALGVAGVTLLWVATLGTMLWGAYTGGTTFWLTFVAHTAMTVAWFLQIYRFRQRLEDWHDEEGDGDDEAADR